MSDVTIYQKNTLRSLRVKFNYTQEEAAKLVGVSTPTLRSWEKNSSKISYEQMCKFEEVYIVSKDYIFFGNEVSFSELLRKEIF